MRALIARQDWIGWVAVGLLGLAVFALIMIILREAAGLARLGGSVGSATRRTAPRRKATRRLRFDVARRLKRLYRGRKDLAWGLARLAEHEGDIMDAAELLRLPERTLVAPLDPLARAIVAASAKRVSVVTAVSPGALIDMLFVGGREFAHAAPARHALWRAARHAVAAQARAHGGDPYRADRRHRAWRRRDPAAGRSRATAKLSARLGEGLFNGALTTRIGLAAIDVCRPLPYIEVTRPRFRELVAEVAGLR